MRRDSFNVLFFIKKTKLLKNGEASVCMRITVNGARVETNIRKSIEPVSWNQAKECARGKSRKSTELNNYIEESRIKLHRIYTQLEENGELITARILQEKFFGVDKKVEQVRTIIGTMREHNEQCRALVGKDFALITVRRYESCTRYLAELLKLKNGQEDIPITEVNGELVRAFEFYLKSEKNCQQNTVIRYMKCLKKHTISDTSENSWKQRKEGLDKIYNQYEVLKRIYGNDYSKIQTEIRKFFASLPENDPAYNSKHYNYVDEKGLFFADNSCAPDRPESRCHKPLIHPITKKETAVPSLGWRWKEETLDKMVEEGRIYFGADETSVPKVKKYLKEMEYELPSTVFYKDGRGASKRLESLLGGKFFDFPKDENVIESFINMITSNDESTIIDFFSGSATTAHAVMKLNAEDGGNRKFIMVQLPEKTEEKSEAYKAGYKNICEIGKERIRRAGKKVKEEAGSSAQNLDTGFRVLKLDSSNMEDVYYTPQEFELQSLFNENVKADRSNEDLLFQVMLDLGIELSAKIESKQIAGKTVHFVDDNYLVACFDHDVNESTITEIAKLQPIYFIMRDASAANDNVIDNFEQIFRHYSPDTNCRII